MDINTIIRNLENYLSNTREFIELRESKNEVTKNPKLNESFNQFQKNQESLYAPNLSQEQVKRLMDSLNNQFEALRSVPEFARYFKAVDAFSVLFNHVMKEVNTSLENKLK